MIDGPGSGNNGHRRAWNAAALVGALALAVAAVATGVAQHEEPAARFVVAECQGFDALASVGGEPSTCAAPKPCGTDDAPSAAGVVAAAARCRA